MLEVFPMLVDNVRVVIENGPLTAEDAKYYIDLIRKSSRFNLKKVVFKLSDTYLDICYSFDSIPFDRIRRIPLTSLPESRAVNN